MIDNTRGGWSAKYFSQEGNVYTVDLAQLVADKGFAHIHAIKANGNVTVSGMYLYRAPDPLQPEKDALQAAIDLGKAKNTFAKTTASVTALSDAIVAGTAELANDGATAESLTAATTAINNAIAGLKLQDGYTNLTSDMYYEWDSADKPTTGTDASGACAYVVGTSTGQPYGDGSVKWYHYADMSDFSSLTILAPAGTPRIMMNRAYAESGDGGAFVEIKDAPVEGKVTVDLTAYDYAHLNAIKGANWQNVTVTEMLLYRTITVGETGYATFGSLYKNAKVNGVKAYAAIYNKETGKVALTEVTNVPAGVGVVIEGEAGEYAPTFDVAPADIASDLKVSNGTVTGDGSTIYVLAKGDSGIGFYKLADGKKLEAGKAYLQIAGLARGFIGFEGATGINEVNVNKAAVKTGKIYNLNGQIVSKPSKGLFIVDGKVVSF